MKTPLQRYIAAVTLAGVAVLIAEVAGSPPSELLPHGFTEWTFVVLLIVGESLPMRIVHHGDDGEITTSSTFALALLLTAGAPATMLAMTVAAIVADSRQRKSLPRTLFNVGQYALSVEAAALAITLTGFHPPEGTFAPHDLPGAVAAAAAFFVVNAVLVARGVAYVEGVSFWTYLRADLALQTSTVGILLGLGPIVVITAAFSPFALPLLGLPLVALHRAGRQAVQHQHSALHDELTGLPHRRLLGERLDQAITVARRDGRYVAVALLDLDGFKDINDTLGHHEGDELLRGVAKRIGSVLRASDTAARLGGDEFAVVFRDLADIPATMAAARAIVDAVAEPIRTLVGIELEVRVSIGVAIAPLDGDDAGTLLRKADIAMYRAKRNKTGVERYDVEIDDTAPDRLQLVAELRRATETDGLILHYQPKVSLETGLVEGFEALMRWEHPRLGLLYPGAFLEEAERNGLMEPLTAFALDAAIAACARWQRQGLHAGVAVNLSPRALREDAIVDVVRDALAAHRLPAQLLQLELTEDSFIESEHTPAAHRVMERLRTLGVGLSLDDFGKGYSSLGHLRDLPVSELKIDRRFADGLADGTPESAIVRSTVVLGHELGLRVVAEGVETPEALRHLVDIGCDAVQGFLLGRPAAADEAVAAALADAARIAATSRAA